MTKILQGQKAESVAARVGGAWFLALVVALATLGLSASNGWSQDVFSAGSGSAEPGPSGGSPGSPGSEQFGAGWENTSVVRGSQQVLRWCKLLADASDVICDDGMGLYGGIDRPKGWSGVGNSPPTQNAASRGNPYRIPQRQANRLAGRQRAINQDPRVRLGNAYARAAGIREYEAGPPKSAIGRQIKNSTRTTQRGANRIPLPSRSSGARRNSAPR